jgi:hypothetical protein
MGRSKRVLQIVLGVVVLGLSVAACIQATDASWKAGIQGPSIDEFPYHSAQFTHFLRESDLWCKPSGAHDFYAWMDKTYADCNHKFPGKEQMSLEELLKAKREQFSRIRNPFVKAENEVAFAAWIHRTIKTVIPRFSLDRGFEFCNVIRYGERQCFLQSTLITGLLQSVGCDAGVVMVFRNPMGQESNNGHAVVLLKLPDGRDIIVDASEPDPFYKPQGIFVKSPDYRYVNPVYLDHSSKIRYYLSEAGGKVYATTQIGPLDYGFVRSQFWYYRGERAKGALLASKPTTEGLTEAQKALEQSVKYCGKNPLSVYMLGRVYYTEGKTHQAKQVFANAYDLYVRFGWIPSGPKRYYDITSGL